MCPINIQEQITQFSAEANEDEWGGIEIEWNRIGIKCDLNKCTENGEKMGDLWLFRAHSPK